VHARPEQRRKSSTACPASLAPARPSRGYVGHDHATQRPYGPTAAPQSGGQGQSLYCLIRKAELFCDTREHAAAVHEMTAAIMKNQQPNVAIRVAASGTTAVLAMA
jgi:hypothetical protein